MMKRFLRRTERAPGSGSKTISFRRKSEGNRIPISVHRCLSVVPDLLWLRDQRTGGTIMAERRRKFWGWGWEDEGPDAEQQERIAMLLTARFGFETIEFLKPPRPGE